jgi:hypothetical protein
MNTLEVIAKRYNLSLSEKLPISIPGISRDDLAVLFSELGFLTGVEIGVYKGEYSEILCKANPNLALYSVDPWSLGSFSTMIKGKIQTQDDYDLICANTRRRLYSYNCAVIRDYSVNVAKDFADNSIDFVYIDGNHDFQNCTNDIVEWSKKVKPGGIISGHDYGWWFRRDIHVYQVVNGYTHAYKIKPWFVIGEGVEKDKAQSWFWIKNG